MIMFHVNLQECSRSMVVGGSSPNSDVFSYHEFLRISQACLGSQKETVEFMEPSLRNAETNVCMYIYIYILDSKC